MSTPNENFIQNGNRPNYVYECATCARPITAFFQVKRSELRKIWRKLNTTLFHVQTIVAILLVLAKKNSTEISRFSNILPAPRKQLLHIAMPFYCHVLLRDAVLLHFSTAFGRL